MHANKAKNIRNINPTSTNYRKKYKATIITNLLMNNTTKQETKVLQTRIKYTKLSMDGNKSFLLRYHPGITEVSIKLITYAQTGLLTLRI